MTTRRQKKNSSPDASLLEKIRLLTIENEVLRKYIADNCSTNSMPPKSPNDQEAVAPRKPRRKSAVADDKARVTPPMPHDPLTPSAANKGCSCKGTCATRVCGCVKKNLPCGEFCRCGDELCQNSEPDKENNGDSNPTNVVERTEKKILGPKTANKLLKNLSAKPRSIFSPIGDEVFDFGDAENEAIIENTSLRFGASPTKTAGSAAKNDAIDDVDDGTVKKSRKKNLRSKVEKKGRTGRAKGASAIPKDATDSEEKDDASSRENDDAESDSDEKSSKKTNKKGEKKSMRKKRNKRISSEEMDEVRENGDRTNSETEIADDEEISSDRTNVKSSEKRSESESPPKIKNKKNVASRKVGVKLQKFRKSDVETGESSSKGGVVAPSRCGPKTDERRNKAAIAETTSKSAEMDKNRQDGTRADEISENGDDSELGRKNSDATPALLIPEETDEFNPMKPRKQLPRSPVRPSTSMSVSSIVFSPEKLPIVLPKTEPEELSSPPADLADPIVDWDEHLANLVQCRKCSRTFRPDRIEKHEKACKKI